MLWKHKITIEMLKHDFKTVTIFLQNYLYCAKIKILTWKVISQTLDSMSELKAYDRIQRIWIQEGKMALDPDYVAPLDLTDNPMMYVPSRIIVENPLNF